MKSYLAMAVGMAACVAAAGQAPYTPSRTAGGQPDLSGIWQYIGPAAYDLEDHSSRMGVPGGYGVVEGGRIPYLPAALKQRDKNFQERATADPAEAFCYRPGVPRATLMPFPFQILQFPDYTYIVYEFLGVSRQLFYKGKHPDPEIDTFWLGDSRARWDGNTLVVDVANFNDQTWLDQTGNFHSDALHVVERYTRTSPDIMSYEATMEDPNVFSRPWKIRVPLYRRQEPNLRLLEYQCHTYMEEEAAKGKVKLPWSHLPLEGVPPFEGLPQK